MTVQPARSISAMAVLLAITACNKAEKRTMPSKVQIAYDYQLVLPDKFKRNWVQGIDSKVEEWQSSDTIVSTDFGQFSGPPTCHVASTSCSLSKEMIGGRPSLVGRYRHGPQERAHEPKPFRYFVHIPVSERYGLKLNMFARCDSEPACDEALTFFRRVRILRTERPGSGLILPDSPSSPPPMPG
jgi:hypothetical protein